MDPMDSIHEIVASMLLRRTDQGVAELGCVALGAIVSTVTTLDMDADTRRRVLETVLLALADYACNGNSKNVALYGCIVAQRLTQCKSAVAVWNQEAVQVVVKVLTVFQHAADVVDHACSLLRAVCGVSEKTVRTVDLNYMLSAVLTALQANAHSATVAESVCCILARVRGMAFQPPMLAYEAGVVLDAIGTHVASAKVCAEGLRALWILSTPNAGHVFDCSLATHVAPIVTAVNTATVLRAMRLHCNDNRVLQWGSAVLCTVAQCTPALLLDGYMAAADTEGDASGVATLVLALDRKPQSCGYFAVTALTALVDSVPDLAALGGDIGFPFARPLVRALRCLGKSTRMSSESIAEVFLTLLNKLVVASNGAVTVPSNDVASVMEVCKDSLNVCVAGCELLHSLARCSGNDAATADVLQALATTMHTYAASAIVTHCCASVLAALDWSSVCISSLVVMKVADLLLDACDRFAESPELVAHVCGALQNVSRLVLAKRETHIQVVVMAMGKLLDQHITNEAVVDSAARVICGANVKVRLISDASRMACAQAVCCALEGHVGSERVVASLCNALAQLLLLRRCGKVDAGRLVIIGVMPPGLLEHLVKVLLLVAHVHDGCAEVINRVSAVLSVLLQEDLEDCRMAFERTDVLRACFAVGVAAVTQMDDAHLAWVGSALMMSVLQRVPVDAYVEVVTCQQAAAVSKAVCTLLRGGGLHVKSAAISRACPMLCALGSHARLCSAMVMHEEGRDIVCACVGVLVSQKQLMITFKAVSDVLVMVARNEHGAAVLKTVLDSENGDKLAAALHKQLECLDVAGFDSMYDATMVGVFELLFVCLVGSSKFVELAWLRGIGTYCCQRVLQEATLRMSSEAMAEYVEYACAALVVFVKASPAYAATLARHVPDIALIARKLYHAPRIMVHVRWLLLRLINDDGTLAPTPPDLKSAWVHACIQVAITNKV